MELRSIDSLVLLAAWLGCSLEQLGEYVRHPEQFYTDAKVRRRRRSSRPRYVVSVADPLRKAHRRIALALRRSDPELPPCVLGFRRRHNIVDNAAAHCRDAEWVATVDIHDFFGSVTYDDVREVFEAYNSSPQVVIALARMCTRNGTLPQGTRVSPAIANRAGAQIDAAVSKLCGLDGRYTRYVDDLTFSGTVVPTEDEIVRALAPCGFYVRPGSYSRRRRGTGQYVTGLFVEGTKPRAPRRIRRSFETFLFYAQRHGLKSSAALTRSWQGPIGDAHAIKAYAEGVIAWMATIDDVLARAWDAKLKRASLQGESGKRRM